MLVRWLALAFAVGITLVSVPSVQSGNGASWTLAQARKYLVAQSRLRLVDVKQSDRPVFVVRFTGRDVTKLRPLGRPHVVRGHRTWQRFAFVGQLLDIERGVPVRVRFVLRAADKQPTQVHGPPPNRFQPRFPMRTTFYYEWFPEGWTQEGIYPYTRFHPSLGYYSSNNPALVRRHIASMLYGRFAVATYDWWGQTSNQDARFPSVLALARQTPLRWAVYYEAEGYGDPTVAEIHADLVYLRKRYFSKPAYLRIGGRPVVFVYGDAGDTCVVAQRWQEANDGINAYLDLSAVPPGYRTALSPYEASNPGGVRVAAGDVSGDTGSELLTSPGPGAAPTVKVLRADGSRVLSFNAGEVGDGQGISLASGDVDGSGKAEIVTGNATGGIRVFALQNGAAVEQAAFSSGLPGAEVAVGDVTGDRDAEVVVGARTGTEPRVKVFDARGRLISSFLAYEPTFSGGVSVAAGDVAGDGRAEIITGTGRASEYRENEVRIFDASGAQAYPAFNSYATFGGGISVAAGDLDGNGHADVITGADADTAVRAYSLDASGPRRLVSLIAFQPGVSGLVSVGAADVNGTGMAEILVGGPPGGYGGEMRIFYGSGECPDQPDAWHVYGGAQYENIFLPHQFGISPGFDKVGTPEPGNTTQPRDIERWRQQIRNMVASNAPWQLVFTFNEWGEGTAVESAREWATPSGYGAYLDVLHETR